jgi:hypothetical protein
VAFITGLCLCSVARSAVPLEGQEVTTRRPLQLAPQISASYFASYVSDDAQTRRWGIDVGARIGAPTGAGIELGYTYVPQAATTSSAAPRLRVFRILLLGSVRPGPASAVKLTGGVGVAKLTVRTQQIDCGDFPLCAEWAPRSGSWIVPAMEVGAALKIWSRIEGLLDVHLLIPHGEAWSATGDPKWLGQLSAGASISLGGGGGSSRAATDKHGGADRR